MKLCWNIFGYETYDFNDNVNRDDTKNILEIKIEDNVGNIKNLTKTFYRKIKLWKKFYRFSYT